MRVEDPLYPAGNGERSRLDRRTVEEMRRNER